MSRPAGDTLKILMKKNDDAIKGMYRRVEERVEDPVLLRDIQTLMRLSRYKGIYEETEDQRVFHFLLTGGK